MAQSQTVEVDDSVKPNVYTQDYSPKPTIEGVQIVTLKNASGEDGEFTELMRLSPNGESELFPGFRIAQINRSTQSPGSIKAWHLHLHQDEVWYVTDDNKLMTGLWDVRKGSPTFGKTMRVVMGGNTHKILYIPRGVAHGGANFYEKTATILYLVSEHFDKDNPDEHRIAWDAMGADFWQPKRD